MENDQSVEWFRYSQLTEIAREAIDVCPYFDEEEEDRILFRLTTISIEQAKILCMEKSPDLMEDFSTFDEYHAQYRSHDDTDHGDSKYPCIVSNTEDEWLLDGWHRFHSYVAKGDSELHLLWYK